MAQLWDAFIQDYQNEIFDWSTRETLEIFWYYCQDGSKAVFKLLKENRKLRDKEIERLRKEKEWLLDNMVYEKEDKRWVENRMQQALKEK